MDYLIIGSAVMIVTTAGSNGLEKIVDMSELIVD